MKKKFGNSILLFFAVIIIIPIFMVVIGSVKSNGELTKSLAPVLTDTDGMISWSLLPIYPTLQHYGKLLFMTPQFFIVFWNSIKISVLILGGQLLVATPAAWGFSRMESRLGRILFSLYIILMLMPFQVTMLSSYLVLDKINVMNTHYAIILPAVFSTFPVFLIYRGFKGISEGIIEAAKIDGANEFFIFIKIGMPLGSSGILSALVLGFLDYWNLVEQPLAFLKDKSLWPLSLYLPEIDLAQAGIAFAASVITLIPAVFVFIIGQDYLEKGIVASALKE